jgi:putative membrane protein
MATESSTVALAPKTEMVKKRTDWSAVNTRFASERTLMAAVRTSLALIGFGFTIYKFFESVRQTMGDAGPVRVKGPRRLGMTLVSLGVFVLVASAWQHWLFLRELKRETDQEFPWSISLTAAVLLAVTGIVVFVTILVRL